jgi:hypothetical protein
VLGLAAATAVSIVLSALAVRSLVVGSSTNRASSPTPSSEATASPSPSPSEAAQPRDVGAYRFMHETSLGPVRWDPCETITYRIDTRAAPRWVEDDLARALREVTEATGIRFEAQGRTTETFWHALNRIRWRGSGTDLVIQWVRNDRYEAIRDRLSSRRPSLAFALPVPGDFAERGRYVGAILVMSESTFTNRFQRGFSYRWSHGVVLMHELGHVMGLDHVRKDDQQVMYVGASPEWNTVGFGSGDREGLRLLGAEQGCLDGDP